MLLQLGGALRATVHGQFSYEPARRAALDSKLGYRFSTQTRIFCMRIDVFRRAEGHGKFSHLAVPHDQILPEEVSNYDWHDEARDIELDEHASSWPQYGIEAPGQQLRSKGYAITTVSEQTDGV